jgi:hypothetical protein
MPVKGSEEHSNVVDRRNTGFAPLRGSGEPQPCNDEFETPGQRTTLNGFTRPEISQSSGDSMPLLWDNDLASTGVDGEWMYLPVDAFQNDLIDHGFNFGIGMFKYFGDGAFS